MRIPGFTAEGSLGRAGGNYRSIGATGPASAQAVSPQLICEWDGPDLICGDGPFGGGVNFGGDKPNVRCNKCLTTCESHHTKAWCLANSNTKLGDKGGCEGVC